MYLAKKNNNLLWAGKIFFSLIIFALSPLLLAVDINSASAEEMARELSGIGPVKARRIVEYREKIGRFMSPEQLTEVKGIGPKTLKRNRDIIEISASSKTPPPANRAMDASLGSTASHTTPPKIEFKDKVEIASHTPPPNRTTDISLNLSPKVEKPPGKSHNKLWDALIIIPLFVACLFIFVTAWLKGQIKDKPVRRMHLLNTIFVCSVCGKVSEFKNIRYEGHFSNQYVDGDLPPGWSCIPNWLGKQCDYCFVCSKKN